MIACAVKEAARWYWRASAAAEELVAGELCVLGSGFSDILFSALLAHPFKKAVGIEFFKSLHGAAIEVRAWHLLQRFVYVFCAHNISVLNRAGFLLHHA